jgi:nitroreductase
MSFEAVLDLISSRYSVFPNSYSGESLPDSVIFSALEAAHCAPTHGKTQPWRFFVFAGDGREKFARLQANHYKSQTPVEQFSEAKHQKLLQNPLKASHIIGIAMQRTEGKIPEVEEVLAVACAVQNLALSLHAYGAVGYWSTGGFTYWEEAKEWFGLSENSKILGFFYVGLPREPLKPTWERGSVAEKVTWIN